MLRHSEKQNITHEMILTYHKVQLKAFEAQSKNFKDPILTSFPNEY